MKFTAVITNPPFQDSHRRGRTPHKLWIEFTERAMRNWLSEHGALGQVSPASFMSPSNRVLGLMKEFSPIYISFDSGKYFPGVGSSFAHYVISKARKTPASQWTTVEIGGETSSVRLDSSVLYMPNVLCDESWSIHRRVIFQSSPKLRVEWDYVTCHNVLLRRSDTLSKEQTPRHQYPVFHTNRQTWWSSVRQPFADDMKVMWSRSGYTIPFFDPGRMGCTDMGYFVRVHSAAEGEHLAANMNLLLMRYIYKTARWSGFGNELVFRALPDLPRDRMLTDQELFELYELSAEEVDHVISTVG